MKVENLIDLLKGMDPEDEVYIGDYSDDLLNEYVFADYFEFVKVEANIDKNGLLIPDNSSLANDKQEKREIWVLNYY